MSQVELKSRIPEIMATLPKRLEEASVGVAEVIAEEAKSRAPVASGTLRDSIEARPYKGGASVVAEFYYFFQEFGTSNQGAQPFMVPAAEMARASVSTIVHKWLTDL